jgi:hypothetical protein
MRIITSSKLKDYYDRFSDPTDKDTVWVRTPELVSHPTLEHYSGRRMEACTPKADTYFLTPNDPLRDDATKRQGDIGPFNLYRDRNYDSNGNYRTGRTENFNFGYEAVEVVFCGVLYRGMAYYEDQPTEFDKGRYTQLTRTRYRVYWTVEQFAADHMEKIDKDNKIRISLTIGNGSRAKVANWFEPVRHSDMVAACVELNTPVLLRASRQPWRIPEHRNRPTHNWLANATMLDTIQFMRRMDPHTAFQELSMFVGGVMVRHDKIEPVSDKLKVLAHGMDERSFRKDPTKVHF